MTLSPVDTATDQVTRWVEVLAPARQLAEVLAQTEFVPKQMRGKAEAITAAIMYGDELGLGPMQALAGIDVVEGRPRPSAELMRALILREGHQISVHEMTGHRCRVSGLRADRPESERVVVEWNTDMARAAGLLNKTNWRSYPRAMLLARATSDLARLLFPDVVKGLGYIAEDLESAAQLREWTPDDRAPVAPELPKKRPQRKRPPRLPSPHTEIATEDNPAPDGSVDVPLPVEGAAHVDPDAEPEAPPKQITERVRTTVNTIVGKVLGPLDRTDRLAVLSAIIDRPIESSSDLTRDEGYRIVGLLHRVEVGAAEIVGEPGGVWVVRDAVEVAEPPAEPEPPPPEPDPGRDPWLTPDDDPWS